METLEVPVSEPVSVYTREQAIEDGVLVDVTELAQETGFKIPVAFTAALWATCTDEHGEGPERVRDVLWLAFIRVRAALRKQEGDGPFPFQVAIEGTTHRLWVVFHPAEGFTIGHPEDF